jgi:ABC-type nickel/cobalt efflux system permease component RcnA
MGAQAKASGNHYRSIRLLAILFAGAVAFAHPFGNLSVNHYARLEPGTKGVDVTYVLDLAEIPSFELIQSWGVPKDAPQNVLQAKAAEQARTWADHLVFTENGKPLTPRIVSTELAEQDGAGNLPVLRVTMKLHVDAAGGHFDYTDRNYEKRAGWREIVIRPGAGADVSKASNSDAELSQALTAFPQDLTKAPQDTRAWFEWTVVNGPVTRKPVIVPLATQAMPVAPIAAPAGAPVNPGTSKRNDAISRILLMKEIPWPLIATLIALAFWFGALHALEPGHGKTMVAAYLVGSRGTPKHAILLGATVTFTHTVSVFILGLGTMFLSRYFMPDRISKVLGIVSGLTIVGIGTMLLWRRARSAAHVHSHTHTHSHQHDHHHHPHTHTHDGHTHTHDGHTHTHGGHTHSHVPEGEISMGSLLALGASGGLVPCPSALVLLLSAISIGRPGLGMILLVAFSLGLAIVLMATGMAVLYAKSLFPERKEKGGAFFRYMPVISAAAIVAIGIVMTSVSLGWLPTMRFFG